MYIETLLEARLLILLDAKRRLGLYNASLSLLTVNRPMHLSDRKLKTCVQTMGGG